jgi:hypothetical protein
MAIKPLEDHMAFVGMLIEQVPELDGEWLART